MIQWEYANATTPREDTSVLVINQLIGRSANYSYLRDVPVKLLDSHEPSPSPRGHMGSCGISTRSRKIQMIVGVGKSGKKTDITHDVRIQGPQ